ncbi:uncharacterized protein LOC110347922 [Heterocephalus glaber]|uniref:Uncharacterized protein LOC110347922 n=1 Tax=Heterocephalus glaber TaxID=10181 RepID=A0AAX6SKE5_HETGA|nr:uncharacterized protein LOC110347922 [Heterocephalus glaber]XP_021109306.1 uncharacterized protein LOC110347922 [Heterocephalus glaber]XP_021109307.1 uncharacterized protein LOC110347922 [Heterocephalus glaber]
MQSFDAKRISPSPAAAANPENWGWGRGQGPEGEIVHFPTRLLAPSSRHAGPGHPGEASEGLQGRRGRARRALPGAAACRRREQTRFWFSFQQRCRPALPHPALENPGAAGWLPHSPSSNAGGKEEGKGNRSFLRGLRRPGPAQPRAGAVGSAPAGERAFALSPAPALPAPRPFPFLWVPVKPSSPRTSAEHHGIGADASRCPPLVRPGLPPERFDPGLALLQNLGWICLPAREACAPQPGLTFQALERQTRGMPWRCLQTGLPCLSWCPGNSLPTQECSLQAPVSPFCGGTNPGSCSYAGPSGTPE